MPRRKTETEAAMDGSARTGTGPEIVFEDVRLAAQGQRLLDGITLRLAAGGLHALIGPNGAGKTSLIRCLLGQSPHEGRIALRWPGEHPGRVAWVPQAIDFDAHLPVTVEDFLGLMVQRPPVWSGLRRGARGQVAAVTARLGLAAKRRTRLGALSGGELRRLLIAQALLPVPDLLILDEPMNHLDAPGVARVGDVLRGLRDAGVTLLASFHDLGHVRALADSVTGLAGGRVVFSGESPAMLTTGRVLALFASGTGSPAPETPDAAEEAG